MTLVLTPAEHRVLVTYCHLGTYKATAFALGCSPRTVRNHLRLVHRKCGVGNTLLAVLVAVQVGSLSVEEIIAA